MMAMTDVVAVLDDGVNPGALPGIGELFCDIEILENGEAVTRKEKGTDISHGTVCAAIIKKYAPTARIASIKVLSDLNSKGSVEQTVKGLFWCAVNHIRVINVSAACENSNRTQDFSEAVALLLARGCAVVASLSNGNRYSLPANLAGVFRAMADPGLTGNTIRYGHHPLNPLWADGVFLVGGEHILRPDDLSGITAGSQNSHAAPVVAAYIHNRLHKNPKMPLNELRKQLLAETYVDAGIGADSLGLAESQADYAKTMRILHDERDVMDSISMKEPCVFCLMPEVWNNRQLLESRLAVKSDSILSVICAGKEPSWLRCFCNDAGIPFWGENAFAQMLLPVPKVMPDSETPIVCVSGETKPAIINIAKRFRDFLDDNGFSSVIFSDISQAYLDGVIWIPPEVLVPEIAVQITKWFDADLIIACIQKEEHPLIKYADILINANHFKMTWRDDSSKCGDFMEWRSDEGSCFEKMLSLLVNSKSCSQ